MPGANTQMRSYHKQDSSEARCLVEPTWGATRWGAVGDGISWSLAFCLTPRTDSLSTTILITVVTVQIPFLLLRGWVKLVHPMTESDLPHSDAGTKMLTELVPSGGVGISEVMRALGPPPQIPSSGPEST